MSEFPNHKDEIIIGRKRMGANSLDDLDILQSHEFPHKIISIKVQVAKFGLCGIQFIYKDGNGIQIKIDGHSLLKPLDSNYYNTFEFSISDGKFKFSKSIFLDDFLQVIYGSNEENLSQIGFITYKGKQNSFGFDTGNHFQYCFMGNTFTCAKIIYVKNYLFQIGLHVVKLPPDFLNDNVLLLLSQSIKVSRIVSAILPPPIKLTATAIIWKQSYILII